LFRAVFGSPAARVFAANAFGKDATKLRTEIAKGGRKRAGGPVTFVICADCGAYFPTPNPKSRCLFAHTRLTLFFLQSGPLELPSDHPVMVARQNTHQSGHPEGQEVLMTIEAFPDGSLALSPDFNGDSPDDVYRIERRDGSVWEYSVRNASKRDETNLEKRQKDIAPTAAMRALQLARRRRQGPGAFVPPPLDSPERLVFLGEIVSGRGFEHDNLYCEWALEFDPEVWKLEYDAKDGKPATAGVTQISKTTVYPDVRIAPFPNPDTLFAVSRLTLFFYKHRRATESGTGFSAPNAESRTGPCQSSFASWRNMYPRTGSTRFCSSRCRPTTSGTGTARRGTGPYRWRRRTAPRLAVT
jgi:hypothetical protein